MFCIKCGKDAVRGNFCADCFSGRNVLFEIENYTVYFCNMCGSHHLKGRKILVDQFMKDMIKTKNRIKSTAFTKKTAGNRLILTVTCTGLIDGISKKETKHAVLTIKNHKCEDCIKISGNYHEAVMQIRGARAEKIMKSIKCPDNILVNVEKVKGGYDIRITDKKKAAEMAQALRQKFTIKNSYKLVGEKKGVKLYRNFYAIR